MKNSIVFRAKNEPIQKLVHFVSNVGEQVSKCKLNDVRLLKKGQSLSFLQADRSPSILRE